MAKEAREINLLLGPKTVNRPKLSFLAAPAVAALALRWSCTLAAAMARWYNIERKEGGGEGG